MYYDHFSQFIHKVLAEMKTNPIEESSYCSQDFELKKFK